MPAAHIDPTLLHAYSRGEITHREIEARTGQHVTFGALLAQLHAHNLLLPRIPSDPRSPGVQLVRRIAERNHRVG
jgi:hypothetical protein